MRILKQFGSKLEQSLPTLGSWNCSNISKLSSITQKRFCGGDDGYSNKGGNRRAWWLGGLTTLGVTGALLSQLSYYDEKRKVQRAFHHLCPPSPYESEKILNDGLGNTHKYTYWTQDEWQFSADAMDRDSKIRYRLEDLLHLRNLASKGKISIDPETVDKLVIQPSLQPIDNGYSEIQQEVCAAYIQEVGKQLDSDLRNVTIPQAIARDLLYGDGHICKAFGKSGISLWQDDADKDPEQKFSVTNRNGDSVSCSYKEIIQGAHSRRSIGIGHLARYANARYLPYTDTLLAALGGRLEDLKKSYRLRPEEMELTAQMLQVEKSESHSTPDSSNESENGEPNEALVPDAVLAPLLPVDVAFVHGTLDCIRFTVDRTAPKYLASNRGRAESPFVMAIKMGDENLVEEMLLKGVPPTATDSKQRSALEIALCSENSYSCVPLLLEAGAPITNHLERVLRLRDAKLLRDCLPYISSLALDSRIGEEGETPLDIVTKMGWIEGITLLTERSRKAAREARISRASILQKETPSTEPPSAWPYTVENSGDSNPYSSYLPITAAFLLGSREYIDYAIEHTEQSDLETGRGGQESPFIQALAMDDPQLVSKMLAKGVSPTACDKDGRSALEIALKSGTKSCVPLLLKHGASIEDKRLDGQTHLETLLRLQDAKLLCACLPYISPFALRKRIGKSHKDSIALVQSLRWNEGAQILWNHLYPNTIVDGMLPSPLSRPPRPFP